MQCITRETLNIATCTILFCVLLIPSTFISYKTKLKANPSKKKKKPKLKEKTSNHKLIIENNYKKRKFKMNTSIYNVSSTITSKFIRSMTSSYHKQQQYQCQMACNS